MSKGLLFIVSAPSGAGKTTLCNKAVGYFSMLEHSVSYTTRAPREGEVEGEHYHFIDDERFNAKDAAGEFIESALVHAKRYGTSGADLDALLNAGRDVMVEIDVQGAAQLREKINDAVFIFILPPSIEACRERLANRGQDTGEVIEKRLVQAVEEIKEARKYDYIIINDVLEEAFESFKAVVIAEKAREKQMIERVRSIFDI